MEDKSIIELYFQRDEKAITESQNKYGSYCRAVAHNILHSKEDTEECVNDTWLRSWNSMPPDKPNRLSVYFGRITRNLAIDRYRKQQSMKHGGGQIAICLDELSECIGESTSVEDTVALKDLLSKFLLSLPEKNRHIFLFRYWYMMPVSDIADHYEMTSDAVKMLLSRTRKKLEDYLKKEGSEK